MLRTIDHGGIREIRMDRPPVNAMNLEFMETMTNAIEAAGRESGAIVVSGAPGLFSAGLDVRELLAMERGEVAAFWDAFIGLLRATATSPVPVAAAITGHCPAGGAVFSLFCDYRVMADGPFNIGLNETRVGLIVPAPIRLALARLTGPHRAERLIVAGTLVEPEEALRIGLVDAIVDESAVVECALRWCRELLELPREAMSRNRELARADLREVFGAFGEEQLDTITAHWFRDSTQAALRRMLESLKKR